MVSNGTMDLENGVSYRSVILGTDGVTIERELGTVLGPLCHFVSFQDKRQAGLFEEQV